MAKKLRDIVQSNTLKGNNDSEVVDGSLGTKPGYDFDPRPEDERKFVAKHKVNKHSDRVGNREDVFNGSKVKKALDDPKNARMRPKNDVNEETEETISEDMNFEFHVINKLNGHVEGRYSDRQRAYSSRDRLNTNSNTHNYSVRNFNKAKKSYTTSTVSESYEQLIEASKTKLANYIQKSHNDTTVDDTTGKEKRLSDNRINGAKIAADKIKGSLAIRIPAWEETIVPTGSQKKNTPTKTNPVASKVPSGNAGDNI